MTRIPDAVAVASLDTHRLIVTVPNDGPADVACNLPRPVAAAVLRQIADQLERPAGRCGRAQATGEPCPMHDAPTPRPAGLDALLDHVATNLPDEEQPTACEQQPRRVLDEEEYHRIYLAARNALGTGRAYHAGTETITDTIDAALAAVGILAPPPLPDDETCTGMFADPDGEWWQCTEEPGHDPATDHDAGDWSWPADHPDAIPPRADQ